MKYSPLSDSAVHAVASNGINILKMPKYANEIAKTIIHKRKSGWLELYWVDKNEQIIYEKPTSLIREIDLKEFPMIGEIVRTEE